MPTLRTQSVQLDSSVMSMLHSRAEHQQLSVEDYVNQLLMQMMTQPAPALPDETKQEKRARAVKALRGIIPDSGIDYGKSGCVKPSQLRGIFRLGEDFDYKRELHQALCGKYEIASAL